MSRRSLAVVALLAVGASSAAAQRSSSHGSDFGISVRAGSLGVGAEISKLLVSHVGVRIGANYFSMKRSDVDIFSNDFDVEAKWQSVTALVDLYLAPRGSFHLTGGLITNPVKATLVAISGTSNYEFNGHPYTAAEVGTVSGAGQFASASPYVGLGFGTPASKGGHVAIVFDLGLAIGKPKLSLTSTGAASNSIMQSDMNAEVAEKQEKIDKAFAYPVLALGLMIKF